MTIYSRSRQGNCTIKTRGLRRRITPLLPHQNPQMMDFTFQIASILSISHVESLNFMCQKTCMHQITLAQRKFLPCTLLFRFDTESSYNNYKAAICDSKAATLTRKQEGNSIQF